MKRLIPLLWLLSLAACGKQFQHIPAAAGSGTPPRAAEAPISFEAYTVTGPYTHENLAVFLIHQADASQDDMNCLTLEEALREDKVRVTEKSDGAQVNALEVENTGDRPVYLQAGDTVKGGQQDRTIAVDFIIPPKSGKIEVNAFCVEPGRWAVRTASATGSGPMMGATFALAPAPVATKEQKLAIKGEKNQSEVWEAGRKVNQAFSKLDGSASPVDSYVLATDEPRVREDVAAYEDVLGKLTDGKIDVVGMAFAINGEMNTVELYPTAGLFRKLWPKLLRGCSLEATAKRSDRPMDKEAKVSEIQVLMAEAAKAEEKAETLSGGIVSRTRDGKRAVLFDTEKDGKILHRQIILK